MYSTCTEAIYYFYHRMREGRPIDEIRLSPMNIVAAASRNSSSSSTDPSSCALSERRMAVMHSFEVPSAFKQKNDVQEAFRVTYNNGFTHNSFLRQLVRLEPQCT